MNRARLKSLLDAEVAVWSQKPFAELVRALPDVAAYHRGTDEGFHQFEVQAIEVEPDYIHVIVSVDDGRLRSSFAPMTRGFIVHRDGRVES